MKKNLKVIQTLMKIGKVVSKIVEVFCIVAVISIALSLVVFLTLGVDYEIDEGVTIASLIMEMGDITMGTVYTSMGFSFVMVIGEGILAKISYNYFKKELKEGTPFTKELSKDLFKLGVKHIVIPVVAGLIGGITYGVLWTLFPDCAELDLTGFGSVAFGLALMVASQFTNYTAELIEKTGANVNE